MKAAGMPWPGDEGELRWGQAWTAIKKVSILVVMIRRHGFKEFTLISSKEEYKKISLPMIHHETDTI